MAEAAALTAEQELVVPAPPRVTGPPVTPGKLAIWLFLGTEIMFFTGLIGTYIVLRAGSPSASYGHGFAPNQVPADFARANPDKVFNWPLPYDDATNPLSIDLTALNTFILICSSVSMVMALAAIQRGRRWQLCGWLLVTVLVGATFLGIQIYEYRSLMFEHIYPVGVSASGHFTPDVSLFASCFFTMTGFHGAHVAIGVLALTILLIRALLGTYTQKRHSPVELVGLYWHFVDLVWIILFTVVYLI
jgi:cytochrome c oxidase subunit 3